MSWKTMRTRTFWVVGTALLVIVPFVQDVGRAGTPLLMLFGSLAALMIALVVFDVAYHAWRAEGQACRTCGQIRRMKSFRFASVCPNCGEE